MRCYISIWWYYILIFLPFVVYQETDHCKTQLPVNAINEPWILSSRCLLPQCYCLYYLLIQSFSSVDFYPVGISMSVLSNTISNKFVCFGNLWYFPAKY